MGSQEGNASEKILERRENWPGGGGMIQPHFSPAL